MTLVTTCLYLCTVLSVVRAEHQTQKTDLNSFSEYLNRHTRGKRQNDDAETVMEMECSNSTVRDLKSVVQIARAVACKPRNTVVKIPVSPDLQASRYFPTHVEIPQCGGICSTLSNPRCSPVETTLLSITITTFSSKSKKSCYTVTMQKHEKCGCECSIREQDCRAKKQIFNRNICQCECVEQEKESRRCEKQNMILDPDSCRCQCRKILSCSTGHLFDPENCRCVRVANNPLINWHP